MNLFKDLSDEELLEAIKQSNNYDEEGIIEMDSVISSLTMKLFGETTYQAAYVDEVIKQVYKEAANRFLKTNTHTTCFECKHSEYSYNPPSFGEGEPDLEFYCNHPCVTLDYEEEITEEDLQMLSAKCTFYMPTK